MKRVFVPHQQLPTNRKFGCFFAGVFAVLAAYWYLKLRNDISILAFFLSVMFVTLALVAPQSLSMLNRLWHLLGLMLGKITAPILLGVIFFLLITPISLILRLFGRDELKLKKRSVKSYWIDRSLPGPPPDSFKNQY